MNIDNTPGTSPGAGIATWARVIVPGVLLVCASGCGITARLEPYKQTDAVVGEGDQIVVLARRHHANYEAEQDIVDCISDELAQGDDGLLVHSSTQFEDSLYPYFEPSTAPLNTDELSELLQKPRVMKQVEATGVRFLVWLDGSTDRVSSGGGITCAAGIGGAGCMGLAWWEDDSRYDATVWDIKDVSSTGTIYADVRGRSIMPAIVIPLPFIARPQAHACHGITEQLKTFLRSPAGYDNPVVRDADGAPANTGNARVEPADSKPQTNGRGVRASGS